MKEKVRVCWVTWRPAPYWTPRFNELSNLTNLDIDIVFLSWGSALQGWKERANNWKFKYSILRKKADESGWSRALTAFPFFGCETCPSQIHDREGKFEKISICFFLRETRPIK